LGITNKNKQLCNISAFRSYGTMITLGDYFVYPRDVPTEHFFYLVVVLRVKIPSPAVVAFHRNISIT
jgi:hypothetical protein